MYDIDPKWVPVFFSNYQLMPWHGGCAWIFQLSEQEPTAAFFQLRRILKKSLAYMGLYDRNELMAHELVHVGRMMFEEPCYEEILAYRTSQSPGRRWWGPLVQSPAESAWFVFLLLPLLFLDLYLIFSGHQGFFWQAMWLKLLPLGLIVAAVMRLYRRQKTFWKAFQNLESVFGSAEKAGAVAYRLTDNEINLFANSSQTKIKDYMYSQQSLRWRVICLAYQNDCPCV
jgi:hypothetical protein